MKKYRAVALGLAVGLYSTVASAIGLGVGLQGGVNVASASAPSNVPTSSVSGLMAGINLELRLTDDVALQPELMYVQRSVKFSDPSGASATAHFDCLELPLLLKIKFLEGVRPFVFGGPVAILNVSRGVDVTGGTTTVAFSPRSTDFAIDLGAGLELGPIFASLRYSLGISELNESSASWSSRGFQLVAGIEL